MKIHNNHDKELSIITTKKYSLPLTIRLFYDNIIVRIKFNKMNLLGAVLFSSVLFFYVIVIIPIPLMESRNLKIRLTVRLRL